MDIFISWSGERSKKVAILLDEWLQCVIQVLNPWLSTKDIDRGSLWFQQIMDQLKDTSNGIVCVTQENKESPWILFEAGALAKGLSTSRICTFLVDLEPSDIRDPLAQFNHTYPTKEGLFDLVRTLNNALSDDVRMKDNILAQVFETYWPQFEMKFNAFIQETEVPVEIEKRSDDDILSEILSLTRSMDRRINILENKGNRNVGGVFKDNISYDPRGKHGIFIPMSVENKIHALILQCIENKVDKETILSQVLEIYPDMNDRTFEYYYKNAKSGLINSI